MVLPHYCPIKILKSSLNSLKYSYKDFSRERIWICNFAIHNFLIEQIEAYFVIRAKKNVQFNIVKWKRRLPKIYYPIPFLNLPNTRQTKITLNISDWYVSMIFNRIENLFFLPIRCIYLHKLLPNFMKIVGRYNCSLGV
jgi:hypothetical protein